MSPAESSHEKLRMKNDFDPRRSETAENAELFRRFSASKPAGSTWEELLYFRNLCSVPEHFPHGSTATTTKEKEFCS
jgi:hypothetical protein